MIVLTAFEAVPGAGTEAGLAWNWGRAYVARGLKVTVLTSAGESSEEHQAAWKNAGIETVYLGGNLSPKAPQTPFDFVTIAAALKTWTAASSAWLESHAAEISMVHHVSWGSVRLRPAFLKVEQPMPTVWGPLGGGQLAKFTGLRPRNVPHELFRAASFPVGWMARRIDFLRHQSPLLSLTTNNATMKYARTLGISAIKPMLADGVQPEMIRSATPKVLNRGPVELIWLGRMVASKRPDIAIGLLVELASQGIAARLTMIGDGPELRSLELRAKAGGVGDQIEFVGRIPWSQTLDYYDRSHFLVFTSMRDSSCPAVLEAAARGVPTLCIRHQGVGDMVPETVAFGPTDFLTTSHLERSLSGWVRHFCSDQRHYDRASRDAVKFARSQTWGQKADAVLRHVLEGAAE